MSKLENVGLSEIVLESFLNSDNFEYFYPKRRKKVTPRDKSHLRTANKKMNNEADGGFRPIS